MGQVEGEERRGSVSEGERRGGEGRGKEGQWARWEGGEERRDNASGGERREGGRKDSRPGGEGRVWTGVSTLSSQAVQ